jgi:LysR family D-serine deaminase transcriptional activator
MDSARMPRLSLDLLRGFRLAARHLSFTRAAQELFVTQSAISREIGKLEEQLGKRLFLRVNRALHAYARRVGVIPGRRRGFGND